MKLFGSFVVDPCQSGDPADKTTYTPFPGVEEEVVGSTTTRRVTYSLAGQAIALRVQIVGGSNTVYHLHTDHLGSTRLMSGSNGQAVTGSTTRYYPFGDWRTEPTANLTGRGYTGHQSNNLGTGLDCFISADTIVPDPAGTPYAKKRTPQQESTVPKPSVGQDEKL